MYDADSEDVEDATLLKSKHRKIRLLHPQSKTNIKPQGHRPAVCLDSEDNTDSCALDVQLSRVLVTNTSDIVTDTVEKVDCSEDMESAHVASTDTADIVTDSFEKELTLGRSEDVDPIHALATDTLDNVMDSVVENELTSDSRETTEHSDNNDHILDQIKAIDVFSKGTFDLETVKNLQRQDSKLLVFMDYLLNEKLPLSQKI